MSNIMSMSTNNIKLAIKSAAITVGVIGLGWMGLPTACLFIKAGAQVRGADINSRIVELIQAGQSHISESGLHQIISKHIGTRLSVTTDVQQAVSQSDIILIIVPTTINNMLKPDYSAVEKSCVEIGRAMQSGSIVIVESTVGPGVTEILIKRILEVNSGFKAGTDFGLAYSPIRAMAGRVMKDIQTYPKIIGGIDKKSLDVTAAIFSSIVGDKIIKVKDLKSAETVKLFENIYRDVNIALSTELAWFCEKAGLDFMEIRDAAITQPYCHLHIPRVGVGGHCIPFNPYFLIDEANSAGVDLRLVRYARRINDRMPLHIVDLITKGLKDCNKRLKRSTIAILGISYRNDVKEASNSPSLTIIKLLTKKGAKVKIYDPYFTVAEIEDMGFPAEESIDRAIEGVDCVLVAVGHKQFKKIMMTDIARLVKKPACLIDGWRIFNTEATKSNNLIYHGVGFGKYFK